jgi:hypothetical protein
MPQPLQVPRKLSCAFANPEIESSKTGPTRAGGRGRIEKSLRPKMVPKMDPCRLVPAVARYLENKKSRVHRLPCSDPPAQLMLLLLWCAHGEELELEILS